MVLADADYFIGLYHEIDVHHSRCILIAENFEGELLTSHDVIDEVVTKLSYFGRKDKALHFYKDIISTGIRIIYPDKALTNKAMAIFLDQKIKHISLTDCMNMAIAKEYKIKAILSFDKIYKKNGFQLVD